MKIKERIAAALDGAGIEKPAELAIPEEKADTRDPGSPKDLFLRVPVELRIKTIHSGTVNSAIRMIAIHQRVFRN